MGKLKIFITAFMAFGQITGVYPFIIHSIQFFLKAWVIIRVLNASLPNFILFMAIIKGIWANTRIRSMIFPIFFDFQVFLGNNLGNKCFFAQFQSFYDDY